MNNFSIRNFFEDLLSSKLVGERVSRGNKKLDNLILSLFLLGLGLLICEIFIYRRTIIALKIPLLIWLIPGIIMTPLFYRKLNHIDGMKAHWGLHYVLHSCITGAFILFSFMAVNYFFSEKEVCQKVFNVEETGSLPGSKGNRNKRKPYVVINYEGMDKHLVFPNSKMKEVMNSKRAVLRVKRGQFGFDVLEDYFVE